VVVVEPVTAGFSGANGAFGDCSLSIHTSAAVSCVCGKPGRKCSKRLVNKGDIDFIPVSLMSRRRHHVLLHYTVDASPSLCGTDVILATSFVTGVTSVTRPACRFHFFAEDANRCEIPWILGSV